MLNENDQNEGISFDPRIENGQCSIRLNFLMRFYPCVNSILNGFWCKTEMVNQINDLIHNEFIMWTEIFFEFLIFFVFFEKFFEKVKVKNTK